MKKLLLLLMIVPMIGFGQTAEEYFSQGNDCRDKGDHEEAIYYYTKAIKIDPDFTDAYRQRAWEYESLRMYKESIEDFTKGIIIIGPDNRFLWEWYQNRGIAYGAWGKTEEAIADYTKAIKINSEGWSAYFNRSNEYSSLGMHKEALEDCTRLIILEPIASSYYQRAVIKEIAGLNNYCSDVKKACDLKDEDACEWYYTECR